MPAYNILTTFKGGFAMNLLPLLLGFVLLGNFNKQTKKENGFDLSQILSNPDLVSLLPTVAKLFDKTSTDEDKNLAIMTLLTNPVIFEIVQKFAGKNQNETPQQNSEPQNEKNEKPKDKQNECNQKNEKQQTFSDESKEFFAPIKDVADKQISKKLYALYDNWYVKK